MALLPWVAGQQALVMNAAAMKCWLISVTRLALGQRAGLLATLDAGKHEQEVCSLVESRLIPTHV